MFVTLPFCSGAPNIAERVGLTRRIRRVTRYSRSSVLRVRSRRCRLGSVAQVVDKFRPLERPWYTDIIVRHITDNQTKVLASHARLAEVRKALHAA